MEVAATSEAAANLNDQAVELQAQGKYAEADSIFKKSLGIWESTVGPEDPLVAQSLANRASLYRQIGEFHEAERIFQLALRIWKKRGLPKNYDTPLWADQFNEDLTLKQFGGYVRGLRQKVERGDSAARAEMQTVIERLGPWYHNVVFAPGIMSNPQNADYPASRWRVLDNVIPKDLKGKSVLDIGCNSGFFSLEMKKRGADRVVGVDIMPHLLAQSRFNSHWFNLPVELYECGAYDLQVLDSKFDVVVFIGVLYHLKHPLYALELIASMCKETMYFQSVVRGPSGDVEPEKDYPVTEIAAFDQPAWPKLYFIEKKFNGDESNWWFATRSCLKAMLRTAGFRSVEDTSNSEIFVCRK
jgi:tRNA (mo5U34)-methyltransferase